MNINNNNYLQSSSLQNLTDNIKNQQNKQSLVTADKKAPASYEVTLSIQALELSRINKSSESEPVDQKSFLEDVFRGVKEQLSIASEAGSTGQNSIEEAGKVFQKSIDSIVGETKGDELSEQQIEDIAKADDTFHQVVDKSYGQMQPAEAATNQTSGNSQGSGGGSEGGGITPSKVILANDLNRDGKVSASELLKSKQNDLLNQISNIFKGSETGQNLNLEA